MHLPPNDNTYKMNEEQLHCHYSNLPSPAAYQRDDIDYDGMGNQGRFPKVHKSKTMMKKLISKIMLWWSYKKPSRSRKSIWKL